MKYPHEELKRRVVKDFLFKSISKEEVGKKYGISTDTVGRYATKVKSPLNLKEPDLLLIKVKEDDYLIAMKILKNHDIIAHEVAPNFELLEYYESSIK